MIESILDPWHLSSSHLAFWQHTRRTSPLEKVRQADVVRLRHGCSVLQASEDLLTIREDYYWELCMLDGPDVLWTECGWMMQQRFLVTARVPASVPRSTKGR